MDYDTAVATIVQHALSTMDECPDVRVPKEGSAEEAKMIEALIDAIHEIFPTTP